MKLGRIECNQDMASTLSEKEKSLTLMESLGTPSIFIVSQLQEKLIDKSIGPFVGKPKNTIAMGSNI